MTESLRIGLLGAGEWGPNVLRAFSDRSDCRIAWVCDPEPARRLWVESRYPGLLVLESDAEAMARADADAIAVCTPTHTHYRLCRAALESGRHVFVEKPLATRFEQARDLYALAESRRRKLMVGHVVLFHPGLAVLQSRLEEGHLGVPIHFSSSRCHWGPVRGDVDVLWDVLPHDLSLLRSWIQDPPDVARAIGLASALEAPSDSVLAELKWNGGFCARLQASWFDPSRTRRVTLVGTKEALTFQESPDACSIRRYLPDGEIDPRIPAALGAYRNAFRGPGEIIGVSATAEPLRLECEAFVDWVLRGRRQPSEGGLGAEVVLLLETLARSLRFGGEPTAIPRPPLWGGTA